MPLRPTVALTGGLALAGLALLGLPPRAAAQDTYWPTHGWQRSSPEAQGMDSKVLAEAFDYIRQHQIPIHSLTIVRNGFIVLDVYFWPFQNGQLHDLASVTKSITSTLVGIAIGQHKLSGVNQLLVPLFVRRPVANRDARKGRITLEHLLTMTSGVDCVGSHEVTLAEMLRSSDWVQFMLDRPMRDEPGSRYEYCSGGMHLLSAVVAQATGENTLDFARRELFGPLGIENVGWPADPHGIPHGWGDLRLQPRDMAKLGYLWLHGGSWEGLQIVPAEWITAATTVHSHPGLSSGQEYGYGFWIYPRRTPPIFEALGRGGQRISVVPKQDLVVVFTGGTFEPGDIGNFIGRSIKSGRPLPEDSAGTARLAAAIADASKPPAARLASAPPALAAAVSGKRFILDTNSIGLASLSLTFPGGAEARVSLELGGHLEQRPVGLDGVPRVSPNGRFGLPVAVSGAWDGGSTFVLTYDEVGNINAVRLRLTFSGNDVKVEMSERSGLIEEQLHGRAHE